MRGKGINYDTGFYPGGVSSREHFDADIVRARDARHRQGAALHGRADLRR